MGSQTKTRRLLSIIVGATLLAFVFSLWVHWPWLEAEHSRLEPATRMLIWSGDVAALLWFVWFGVRYCLLGHPLPDTFPGDAERRYVLVSLLGAIAIDVAISGITAYHEVSGENRKKVIVPGEIIGGRPTINGVQAYIVCRFLDSGGVLHESHHQVRLEDQPLPIREAIRLARFPIPVHISYDHDWPQRCWIAKFDNEDGNRLYFLSLSFLTFQLVFLPLALTYGVWRTEEGVVPLYEMVPLWAQLTPFFLAAAGKFCIGEF
jgi:hypothetical protein